MSRYKDDVRLLDLPDEMIGEVLQRLPAPDLAHMSETCKSVRTLATSNDLWENHARSSFESVPDQSADFFGLFSERMKQFQSWLRKVEFASTNLTSFTRLLANAKTDQPPVFMSTGHPKRAYARVLRDLTNLHMTFLPLFLGIFFRPLSSTIALVIVWAILCFLTRTSTFIRYTPPVKLAVGILTFLVTVWACARSNAEATPHLLLCLALQGFVHGLHAHLRLHHHTSDVFYTSYTAAVSLSTILALCRTWPRADADHVLEGWESALQWILDATYIVVVVVIVITIIVAIIALVSSLTGGGGGSGPSTSGMDISDIADMASNGHVGASPVLIIMIGLTLALCARGGCALLMGAVNSGRKSAAVFAMGCYVVGCVLLGVGAMLPGDVWLVLCVLYAVL
eukprot:TRINITY_DN6155_c0_g1_i1.p1 TRINITY_DN6155_c0_g1~~TRINITY_DN6155_c0_g1_i1.p1  ORF type:complete len:397 (-),score=82.42 TRINITY_DN6155_c0_g1_i1:1-1191(-)